MSSTLSIFDIPLCAATEHEWAETIRAILTAKQQCWMATINAEILVRAYRDPDYRALLQGVSYATIDGSGIIYLERLKHRRLSLSQRMTGVRLTALLLDQAILQDLRVAILLPVQAYSSADEIENALQLQYPQLSYKIFTHAHDVNDQIRVFKPAILFVTYGSPAQDEWISQNLITMPTVTLAVGVGGTFDFISGKIKRAPKLLQAVGLEWLWRLFIEPKRIKRIFNAVVIFPYIMLLKT